MVVKARARGPCGAMGPIMVIVEFWILKLLLQDHTHHWAYLDSSGRGRYGSAATVYLPCIYPVVTCACHCGVLGG